MWFKTCTGPITLCTSFYTYSPSSICPGPGCRGSSFSRRSPDCPLHPSTSTSSSRGITRCSGERYNRPKSPATLQRKRFSFLYLHDPQLANLGERWTVDGAVKRELLLHGKGLAEHHCWRRDPDPLKARPNQQAPEVYFLPCWVMWTI